MSGATDVQPRPTWAEAFAEVDKGTYGTWDLLRTLATASIIRSMDEMGIEGCGISSSDINHTVYGAVSWAMQYGLDAESVQAYLGA